MMAAVDPGAVILVVVMVLLLPALLTLGLVLAVLLGWRLRDEAEASHPGSELIDLNR
jgi:hypothetical protein